MFLNILKSIAISKTNAADSSGEMAIGSGPGAVMFEQHGQHTRIRRAPVRAIAAITWENGPREVFGQVVNISPGGCLVKTESTIAPGTVLDIAITIIGNGKRSSADVCAVVRRETEHEGRRAYGVEFVAMTRGERETIQWLYGQAMGLSA